jgi:membrane protease YdiL (CAAX protease family)
MEVLATFALLSVVASGIWLWSIALRRLAMQQPVLPLEPRSSVPWGLLDVLLPIVLVVVVQLAIGVVIFATAPSWLSAETLATTRGQALSVALSSGSTLVAFVVSIIVTWLRAGATAAELGYQWRTVGEDILLGVAAFCMLAPIVFLIQFLLVSFWEPTQHPLILMLKDHPEPSLFLVASFAAVAVAPVVEEYFFRGLMQGWLESLTRRHHVDELLLGVQRAAPGERGVVERDEQPGDTTAADAEPLLAELAAPSTNPYVTPNPADSALADADVEADLEDIAHRLRPAGPSSVPVWPMFVSAAIFALAHFSHGPDWIPLFVLALGLGFLFQRTHRLLPCMTVHFLLNLASMGVLYIEVFLKPAAS